MGFLLLPLSQDKGTPGQENFFVLGQRDNGTSRPAETLVETSSSKQTTGAKSLLS